jgi:glucokinase
MYNSLDKDIAVGIDIGGSHVCSAGVDLGSLAIIEGSSVSLKVNNKDTKSAVLKVWGDCINATLSKVRVKDKANLGFAMPGPFHYKTGLAMFKGNDKYENLYKVSVPDELRPYIDSESVSFRFLNDATAFGVGASAIGKAKNYDRVIAITLGTGFGSCFIVNGIPDVKSSKVPKDGCLWDKPYQSGISDDYFSTRWCIQRYWELTGERLPGVREIAEAGDVPSRQVFEEFGTGMANFITPYLKTFNPDLIIFGGNISRASSLFLPVLKEQIARSGVAVQFQISDLMEEAAIIGSAKLFDPVFWKAVRDDLPKL